MTHEDVQIEDIEVEIGFENASDVARIYRLIEILKDGNQVKFVDDVSSSWQVVFRGSPSLSHANKIYQFKDYLSDAIHTDLRIVGAKSGSVEVFFASDELEDTENNKSLISDFFKLSSTQKEELLTEFWIEKISFGNNSIEIAKK
jgi:hypothetical protein